MLRTRTHCPAAVLQLPTARGRTHTHRAAHNLRVEHLHSHHFTLLGQLLDSLLLHPSLHFLLLLVLLFLHLQQALFLLLRTLLATHAANIILQNKEAFCCKASNDPHRPIARTKDQRRCYLCIFLYLCNSKVERLI